MENHSESQLQFTAMPARPEVRKTILIEGERKKVPKKKERGTNPSLDSYSISQLETGADANTLREKYVPFCLETNEIKPKLEGRPSLPAAQGSPEVSFPGCMNVAGKLRQL